MVVVLDHLSKGQLSVAEELVEGVNECLDNVAINLVGPWEEKI